ncbi:MAG TPA: class I SAM-dependent methyltransferase [Nitrososphaerales archaeon]|nr:class I SAM-dependent methyltransferase [Nitrososphaerales archaeon]
MNFFNEAYRGVPPWDIGRPQPVFAKLAASEDLGDDIIDVGCGTGEQAMLFASSGYKVLGVDSAPLAIEKARTKSSQRGLKVEFMVADALHLAELHRQFDVAIDSGLFHVFSDRERLDYVESLRTVLRPRGRYYMLCFSDKEPVGWGGPRRVFKREILTSFSDGWHVDYVRPAKFASASHEGGGEAWFSKVTKT